VQGKSVCTSCNRAAARQDQTGICGRCAEQAKKKKPEPEPEPDAAPAKAPFFPPSSQLYQHPLSQHLAVDKLVSLARLHCQPLTVGVNVDNYTHALYAFAHDHCAMGRTFALRGVGLLLRRLLGLFVPRACCSLARRASFGDFSSDAVLCELQKFMLSGVQGAETTLTTHEVDGELRLLVPPEHTKRHS
jgi:hypothetical protein